MKIHLRMHSMTTVALCFVAVIHFTIASGNQTNPMEDDLAILNKYLEMDQQMKKFVNSGIKQFLPYFMEANEHFSLSPKCTQNLLTVISGLRKLKLWALSFVDASGKLPDGILWINLQMIGNFDQCLNITVFKKDGQLDFRGKHCIVVTKPFKLPKDSNEPHLDFEEATQNASEIIHWFIKSDRFMDLYTPRFGMCVPSGCSQADVQQVVEYYSRMVYMNSTITYCQVEGSFPVVTTRTAVIMFIFALLIALGIAASGLEYYLKLRPSTKKDGWKKLLLCFSITSNFQKVVDTTTPPDSKLACLHGIRTLTMFYITTTHRFGIPLLFSFISQGANIITWSETFFSRVITNGFLTADAFFFMGGLLNSYLRKEKEKKVTKSGPIQFLLLLLFRIWRLYPAYISAILLNYLFVPRGPLAPLAEEMLWKSCDKNWWRNFLFIHNFFNVEEMCLKHTWYISVEMQLFIFALLPVTLILRYRRKGYIIGGIIIICGIIISIQQAWILKLATNASELIRDGTFQTISNIQTVQFRPFAHIAPYFIGVLLGDFLSTHKEIKIPVVFQIVGWMLASFIYLTALFVNANLDPGPQPTYKLLITYFFIAYRPLSVLAIAWMVFCCAYGYGGIINYILTLKIWMPISRLSYFMYLNHLILQVFYIFNQRTPPHVHKMVLIWQYLGDVAITGLLSLVMTVLVESPNIALMKIALESISKDGKKPTGIANEEMKNGSTVVDGSSLSELKTNSEKKDTKL